MTTHIYGGCIGLPNIACSLYTLQNNIVLNGKKYYVLKCCHACCYPVVTTTSGNSVSCIKKYLPFQQ